MTIMNGWKIRFGDFIGSTYAFNQLKKLFDEEFNQLLFLDHNGLLCITIQDEEKENEDQVKMMYYFIKGYCMAHKNISFHKSNIF